MTSNMKLTILVVALSGCAGREWRTTVKTGTSEAYTTYVANHSGTMRANVAARRAEDRGWLEAGFANTSTSYAGFAAAFPNSEHAAEAQTLAEARAWDESVAANTIPSFSAFVSRYPSSAHLAEANAQIEELWYADAKYDATEASWSRYLVRYPDGVHAEEASREREKLVWSGTVISATRLAYQRYVERFPTGAHIAEAQAWLAGTYVTTLQPVVALIGSWQPVPQHAALLARIKREVESGFVPDLARDFTVLPVKTWDGTRGFPHPHDAFGVQPGVGILVLEYTEKKGRKFDPSGNATDITAVLRLYAPNTRTAVWVRELDATTSDRVLGTDLTALNTGAIVALTEQLRSLDDELARNRKE